MKIKDQETTLTGANLIRALLRDEFGYNHVCKCGKEQTFDGCKQMIKTAKLKNKDIEHDFVCSTCRKIKPCTVFGITYQSVKEAAEASYDPEKCRCEVCGKEFTKDQWYQWCQRYLEQNNGRLICHSCKSSEVRIQLNERDHEQLSQAIRERNLANWQDEEYRKKKAEQQRETIKRQWADTEKKYGENGDLTFAEMRSQSAFKTLSRDTGGAWSSPNYWQTMLLGRSSFAQLDISDDDKIEKFLDVVDKLYEQYVKIYSNIISNTEETRKIIEKSNAIMDIYGIKHDLYSKVLTYCAPLGSGMMHHIIPKSIIRDDELMACTTKHEHLLCHLALLLDNFNRKNNPDITIENGHKISENQIKIFMALCFLYYQLRNSVVYASLINDISEFINIQTKEALKTEKL